MNNLEQNAEQNPVDPKQSNKLNKRVLFWVIVIACFLLWRLTSGLDPQWKFSGEYELSTEPAEAWPYLAELQRWPEWLVWKEHPFPKLDTSATNAGYPMALIRSAESELVTRLTVVETKASEKVVVSVNRSDLKLAGYCLFELFPTRRGSDIEWHCSGRYNLNSSQELWAKFGVKPELPFDPQASMRRLQLRFE